MIESYAASLGKRDRSPVVTVRFMACYGPVLPLTRLLFAAQSPHLSSSVYQSEG